jgi:glucan phosphoethanolaminetransferase (alkaline phosphatase superfamily)
MNLSSASSAQRNAGSGRESSVAMRAMAAAVVCGSVASLLAATKTATDCIRDGWAATARPSMILVIIDTLRADRLGTYGYSRATSPRLDAFAKQSVLFETRTRKRRTRRRASPRS